MRSVFQSPSLLVSRSKVKDYVLSALTGLLLILSFPGFNLWIFAWLAFLPLFIALERKSKIKSFLLAYLTGIIFWAGAIYWLIHVTLSGTIILILYLALFFGFFGLLVPYLLPTTYYLLLIPCLWVLLEYLRSYLFTGFPWALLGYSQYLNLPAIQIADITGAWGVSFLVMLVNVGIYSLFRSRTLEFRSLKIFTLSLVCLTVILSYGYYRGYEITRKRDNEQRIRISVIQANIPQDLKWDAKAKDFIFHEYFSLTRQAAEGNPDLIIWPEAASPAVIGEDALYGDKISFFVRKINRPLLLGAVTAKDGLYYNSALLFSRQGAALESYDKLHLVPFGEYIPLKNIFGFLETVVPIGDIAAGKDYTVFSLPANYYLLPTKFSVLICFEDLFPELSRRFVKRGAVFLVNITNDAWYKKTSAAHQHFQASVFRAVENRVNLIRAANTGVSGFISPAGRVSLFKDSAGETIFIKGYRQDTVNICPVPQSFYSRYGDIFILICLIFIFCGLIFRSKRTK